MGEISGPKSVFVGSRRLHQKCFCPPATYLRPRVKSTPKLRSSVVVVGLMLLLRPLEFFSSLVKHEMPKFGSRKASDGRQTQSLLLPGDHSRGSVHLAKRHLCACGLHSVVHVCTAYTCHECTEMTRAVTKSNRLLFVCPLFHHHHRPSKHSYSYALPLGRGDGHAHEMRCPERKRRCGNNRDFSPHDAYSGLS